MTIHTATRSESQRTGEDGSLPAGWVWTTLGQIADITGGVTKGRDMGRRTTVKLPYLRVANVQRGYLDLSEVKDIDVPVEEIEKYRLKPNDLLLTEGGDWDKLGRAAVWRNQIPLCIHQNHIFRARLRSPEIPIEWLVYYINSEEGRAYFSDASKQTTNLASINLTQLKACPIPLAPLPEQRRIVAAIEEHFSRLDAGVAALKRAKANLQRYKAAVLKAACEGRLVPQDPSDEPASVLLERILAERRAKWEADLLAKGKDPRKVKYEEPQPPDTEGLPELPGGWIWARFDQLLLELKNGYFSGTPASEPPGIPILRISAVRPLSINFDAPKYLPAHEWERAAPYKLRDGDLLFTRYNGTLELVGACGMVKGVQATVIYPDKLIRVRVPCERSLPSYLELYFATLIPRRIIEAKAKSTAGQTGISGADLKNIPVALPPMAEQQRIVAEVESRLSLVQSVEASIETDLARSEWLRQAILRRAFSGRLVAQDPTDEPAANLLEFISGDKLELRPMQKRLI